jgi:hypothetical protein
VIVLDLRQRSFGEVGFSVTNRNSYSLLYAGVGV